MRGRFHIELRLVRLEALSWDLEPGGVARPPLLERRHGFIDRLGDVSDDAPLAPFGDKRENARAILRDYRRHGNEPP